MLYAFDSVSYRFHKTHFTISRVRVTVCWECPDSLSLPLCFVVLIHIGTQIYHKYIIFTQTDSDDYSKQSKVRWWSGTSYPNSVRKEGVSVIPSAPPSGCRRGEGGPSPGGCPFFWHRLMDDPSATFSSPGAFSA